MRFIILLLLQSDQPTSYCRLTVAMMSRITINLKKSVYKVNDVSHIRPELPSMFSQKSDLKVDSAGVDIGSPGLVDSQSRRASLGNVDSVPVSRVAGMEGGECDDEKSGWTRSYVTPMDTGGGPEERSKEMVPAGSRLT